MKERIEKVKQDYKVNPDLLNRWQQWLNTDEYWPKVTGMIHGDGHVGHMMINEAGEITGRRLSEYVVPLIAQIIH